MRIVLTAVQGEADYLLTADADILAPAVRQVLTQAGIQTATIDEFIAQIQ